MLLVILVCVGTAIYAFINHLYVVFAACLIGIIPKFGIPSLIVAAVLFVSNGHIIPAVIIALLIIINAGYLIYLKATGQR